jgi:flagellar biosynthesis/type III secretory pathway protein FliH
MLLRSRTPITDATLIANPAVTRALVDWEQRVQQAKEDGRRAGLAEAEARIKAAEQRAAQAEKTAEDRQLKRQQDLLARFEPILAALSAGADRLAVLEHRLVRESEAECVRLAVAIAAAVLRRTPTIDRAWMDRVVAQAFTEIPDRRGVAIRMHPHDAAALRERVQAVHDAIPGIERLDIIGDEALAPGSCVLMSQGTRLDTSLAGCWDRLAQNLLAAAPSAPVEVASDEPTVLGGGPEARS